MLMDPRALHDVRPENRVVEVSKVRSSFVTSDEDETVLLAPTHILFRHREALQGGHEGRGQWYLLGQTCAV